MLTQPFADRLFHAVHDKKSAVVVGLDPDISLIPPDYFKTDEPDLSPRAWAAMGVTRFLKQIIDAVADAVVAVKPQLAYFERLGPPGLQSYEEVIAYARKYDLLTITDGKRNDISSTASQYALAYLGPKEKFDGAGPEIQTLIDQIDTEGPKADALTINGYLGRDGVEPFIDELDIGQGLFILVKTSNPSSDDLQDLNVVKHHNEAGPDDRRNDLPTVAEHVASWVEHWNGPRLGETGYGPIGAVVGATHPKQLIRLRELMPTTPFLIPGFGAQGGTADDVIGGFDEDGRGAVVNSSRGILYAYRHSKGVSVEEAARKAAVTMRDAIWKGVHDR